MEIKQIRLSPKRGGNGFISSYSVNIGIREARECFGSEDLSQAPIVKLLDPQSRQIILRRKEYTLTREIVDAVCSLAADSRRLNQSDKDPVLQQARLHDERYYTYLLSLPLEALTDLVTLMCMGRDQDVDRQLAPAQRFLHAWQQLEQYGTFSLGPDALASQLMYDLSLDEHLHAGLAFMDSAAR